MTQIKIIKNFLSKENKNFINTVLLSSNFPYYLSEYDAQHPHDANVPSYKVLCHSVLQRKEDRIKPGFNSEHYKPTLNILNNFFIKAGITKVNFHRICYNYTFNIGVRKSYIHEDHAYSHSQAILYLSKVLDKDTPTVILKKKNKVIKKIKYEMDKGVIFDKTPHYHVFPRKGARLVLVATFNKIN